MFPADLQRTASALLSRLRERGLTLATAESCTGGLVTALFTEIAGSSDVIERGYVTYSNAAKSDMLGVNRDLIAGAGAVSAEVAAAMADGVLRHAPVNIAVAITGVAGPGGGSVEKPVGLVYLAARRRDGASRDVRCLFGDVGRDAIRLHAVREALALIGEVA
ncbi:MAG: CinA family protein [Hyphomicrobium sp.]|nr:CinA family protein [Hyphomicrobium sp.]